MRKKKRLPPEMGIEYRTEDKERRESRSTADRKRNKGT